jgi:hypothetical protein
LDCSAGFDEKRPNRFQQTESGTRFGGFLFALQESAYGRFATVASTIFKVIQRLLLAQKQPHDLKNRKS